MATLRKTEELKRRKQRHKEFIRQIKEQNPCSDCGGFFHHSAMKYIGGKEDISKMALYSKDRISQEIENRTLICSNCSNYRNWLRNGSDMTDKESVKLIRETKTNNPCSDCGKIYHFSSMEFDHRPGTVKRRNLSKMDRYSILSIEKELLKCDVVCSNCHHVRTWTRLNKIQSNNANYTKKGTE